MPILNWLNRDKHIRAAEQIPYRLLEPQDDYSFGVADTSNMLVQGDNLDALKALLPYYARQVKCIYIDPPYNTRSAFEHYDDNLEHAQWLSLMYPRLELLREMLTEDGSIWVSIDDSEAHYLKIIMDEIFGRKNFLASNVWQKRYSRENREAIGDVHEYIFVYAVNPDKFKKTRNLVSMTEAQAKVYRNPNNDPRGRWRSVPMTAQEGHATPEQFYEITTPSGKTHRPPEGRCWGMAKATYQRLLAEGKIYFGKNGDSQPNLIRYLSEVPGVTPWTWWPSDEVGHTDESKKEIHALFGKVNAFDSPKPERLMQRILQIATNPNDLVLDSFLGSGTTAAVAHKMGRRYIGIEMGEHAKTHCVPRLQKVIEGEQGGISELVNWKGGGGFRYYQLGSAVFDSEGRINPQIQFANLAAHIWFSETRSALHEKADSPYLGTHNGTAYYLLYNGILGDKRPDGGNVLTSKVLSNLPSHDGPKVIYGETSRLGQARLKDLNIIFKQTPYDVKVR
ncbi:site-specific DNA-methyltransferase [Desulfosporosinus sp. Sb-LF]|uniref:site-specific DNA-methyltransferase n=1 Tax=Desulfosporosinus sp. Sb-LF TaxID=2560027 RepID=UPI00107F42FC|nr:site-specific DNA-methyltransferase [Desulfosporosinus sp. Sb-LF]TGE33358.1 site-specific DNA-methyltransferase [Desulfosporosinus sp. Sb-LF]